MVSDFIQEKIFKDVGAIVTQKDVYEKYILFCESKGEKPESKIWFGRTMNIFDFPSKQISNKVRIYRDIGVKD